mgnify:CR=1 FL=1
MTALPDHPDTVAPRPPGEGGFSRLLGRLSVSRKLMLIYLLDLSAVIYVSGILINEKFLAIDFARKEVQGNAYVQAVRDPLVEAAMAAISDGALHAGLPAQADRLAAAEATHGAGLDSGAPARQLAQAVREIAGEATARRALPFLVLAPTATWMVVSFDALFAEALASKLAYEACYEVTQSNQRQDVCNNDYRASISDAVKTNAIEKPPQGFPDDSWVLGRL